MRLLAKRGVTGGDVGSMQEAGKEMGGGVGVGVGGLGLSERGMI